MKMVSRTVIFSDDEEPVILESWGNMYGLVIGFALFVGLAVIASIDFPDDRKYRHDGSVK